MEKIIDFPIEEATKQVQLSEIIQSLATHLETQVTIESVSLMRVKYDGSCHDIDVILKQLAGDPAGFKVKKIYHKRDGGVKPLRMVEETSNKHLDPLGS